MDILMEKINKSYGDKEVLRDFTTKFEEGTVTFITGESGIGKTSIIRILMGLEGYQSGSIRGLEGKEISVVFQDDCLCDKLSLDKNLSMVLDGQQDKEQDLDRLLDLFGLEGYRYKRVAELSGGMKRRLAILRAILYPHNLMILDEPFKGLDEENKKLVMGQLAKGLVDKTAIIVTHDKTEIDFFRSIGGLKIREIDMNK
ncbi:MAG: ATP-binding cassette domain-containing protein [Peptostreptococcus sp.]|jgi:ABC transporter, ATP-binding protein|uniref:ABC transporter ATP-binding protein n=1 Tax=Peptostreptococcus sp. TaxID=1262 RepID=UPI001CAB2363|nr:ATP-binding cassette domain-containing protein [Peptostreptococcus sp.]MBF1045078.1 ATP-binding cassette domain-containing protein [Peptostreptococcus sp.]